MQKIMSPENGNRVVNLDIRSVVISETGIDNFYWPVGYGEIRGFCLDVLGGLAAIARKARTNNWDGHVEFSILSHYLVGEAMGVFQGQTLVERCSSAGITPQLPEDFRIWPALQKRQVPALPPFFAGLQIAFPKRTFGAVLKKRFNKLTGKWARRKKAEKKAMAQTVACKQGQECFRIHSRRLSKNILKHEIVTTKRGDIQSQHAAQSSVRVTLAAHKNWFFPLDSAQLSSRRGRVITPLLQEDILNVLRRAFERYEVSFPRNVQAYFQEYLDQGAALVACHLERLRKRPEKLPAHIWTGTGGNIWDRLLRVAVREQGGRATGHSHAGGFHHRRAPEQNSAEFLACDEFVVYNDAQVKYTLLGTDTSLLFEEQPPVVAVGGEASVNTQGPAGIVQDGPVEKIMYVACNYLGERQAFDPPVHDLVAVDFQVRMFRELRERGYEVLYKPHPESDMPPPEKMERVTGAIRIDQNFEAVVDMPDLYLFDNTNSTTFKVALKTRKPIVYIDTNTDTWCPEVYEQLGRRCAIVKASFDTENRIQMDWDALLQAINVAPELAGDLDFVREHVI